MATMALIVAISKDAHIHLAIMLFPPSKKQRDSPWTKP
jgi:hypothetical protein